MADQPQQPSHAQRCRTLVRRARVATLSTLAVREPEGWPYGSLVSLASDSLGRPLLLLSSLAEHTANLAACSKASILVTEPLDNHEQALASGRVTLLGACEKVGKDDDVRATFLAQQPSASAYVDFADFAFYRLEPAALRYVGGFGRMSWVAPDTYRDAEPDPLIDAASGILEHMNDDHADAVLSYARVLAGIEDASSARMVAVDRYGFDLLVATPAGARRTRLAFDEPVATNDEVRRAMITLVKRARAT